MTKLTQQQIHAEQSRLARRAEARKDCAPLRQDPPMWLLWLGYAGAWGMVFLGLAMMVQALA